MSSCQRKFAAIEHDANIGQLVGVVVQELAQAALGVDELDALRQSPGAAFDMGMAHLVAWQVAGRDVVHHGLLDVRTMCGVQQVLAQSRGAEAVPEARALGAR